MFDFENREKAQKNLFETMYMPVSMFQAKVIYCFKFFNNGKKKQ